MTDRPSVEIDREAVYEGATEAWGEASQIDLAIEELGELVTELARIQNGRSSASEEAVVDEIADVQIAIDQLKRFFGESACETREREKMERLKQRVEEAQNGA